MRLGNLCALALQLLVRARGACLSACERLLGVCRLCQHPCVCARTCACMHVHSSAADQARQLMARPLHSAHRCISALLASKQASKQASKRASKQASVL